MNNKGFAITGILYTLFILFLLILISILSGLSIKKNILSHSINSLENSYLGKEITITNRNNAQVDGKYVYILKYTNAENGGTETTHTCTTYLKKGTDMTIKSNMTFTPKDCNNYEFTVNTSNGNLEDKKITLVKIYSFEG